MKVLVRYLKGKLKGRLDLWNYGSALIAEKNGIVKIIKIIDDKIQMVTK